MGGRFDQFIRLLGYPVLGDEKSVFRHKEPGTPDRPHDACDLPNVYGTMAEA